MATAAISSPTSAQHAPLVLLHGVGLDRTMWRPLRAALSGHAAMADREVISLDLPGHGERPPLRGPQTLGQLADDVLARMPETPAHVVGFSLGALIAQHLARHAPERTLTLACVSGVCRRTPDERAAVEGRLRNAERHFAESVQASLERWFPAGTTVSAETIAETERVLLANDQESYLHAYSVFAHADQEIATELSGIRMPVLAVTGEHDPGSTPEMSYRLALAIPGTRVEIVPGARHMLPVENPGSLARAIADFITVAELASTASPAATPRAEGAAS
ncbi:alpha/beta fold hydrolase [Ruicaihuangia caeni]|uniref:Alpha/beta fold hydrolase n=1 Tax=Ruicaihuangia caeni TaxID=3042517 RepID=A0AAW6T7G5_9MICO|nr:alpha/beta fold hydrolase [Klugiella sp. YN-L-19]MDI2098293.1 alpha/beta fold hydrolase [Klugiella sp. YN-L-19]